MRVLLFIGLMGVYLLGASFLMPEEAFKPRISMADPKTVAIDIDLGEQIYIYADKLHIEDMDKNDGIDLGVLQTIKPVDHDGEKVFEKSPAVKIALSKSKELTGEKELRIKLSYQGCSSAGLCYEPLEQTLKVTVDTSKLPSTLKEQSQAEVKKVESAVIATQSEQPAAEPAVSEQKQSVTSKEVSETDQIAGVIQGGSIWFIILTFFGFGLLLALTPCVFPMIPIISSVIVAQGEGLGAKKAFWLSVVYVLSMAIAYTIAGVLAGMFGSNLQAAFQTPWIITLFALIFVVLALSMFDLYELQVPNFIQSRVTRLSGQKGGIFGVAIMGFLSALIVGPCVAAPLAGALIYIGQTGDAVLGGTALFALSIGMGIPLLAVGTTAGKFMPKPGMWMDTVKAIFGVMLIGVAIWMVSRILEENMTMLLWGSLALFVSINMGALEPLGEHLSWSSKANRKAIAMLVFLYSLTLLIGGMAGAKNMLHPLDPFLAKPAAPSSAVEQHKQFERITSLSELESILTKHKGEKVMVDFYADWCTACKEFEEKTFSNEAVKTQMDNFVLVKVDLTANDDKSKEISQKFGIFGPPAILFFDNEGKQIKEKMVVGFKEPAEFEKHLKDIP